MPIRRLCTSLLLLAMAMALLPSCGPAQPDAAVVAVASPYTPRQIAEVVIASSAIMPPMLPLLWEDDYFAGYLFNIYAIEGENLVDGAVYYADGVFASEIAVLWLAEEAKISDVEAALSGYIKQRENAFTGYAPDEALILKNSRVATHGNYVALLICQDAPHAEAAFLACFSENPPALPSHVVGGSGTEQPAPSSDEAEQPEPGSDEAEQPAPSSDEAGQPEPGSDEAGQPAPGSDEAEQPEPGSDEAEQPAPGSDEAEQPAPGGDEAEQPAPGSDEAKQPAPGSDEAEQPAPGSDEAEQPAPGSDEAERPEQSAPDSDEAGRPGGNEYDHAAILAAWARGNDSALSEKNRSILEACAATIAALITDQMSELEKETAIHDWIIRWADYDTETLNNAPDAKPDPDNDNPYGLLIHKKAVCMGYALTFQLFMDLLDIECILVNGTTVNGEHAWNMVRIDGLWYCVDVTWNDPIRAVPTDLVSRRFFNVTSAFLRETGHQWDESTTPEADNRAE